MVGYSQDITAQLQATRALQASEARYRILFEASPVGIGVCRPDGSLAEANDALLRMTGWSREDFAAGTAAIHLPSPDAEELLRRDGVRLPVLVQTAKGTAERPETIVYVLNLSQQRAAEEAARRSREYLELAIDSAGLGVWDWDIVTGHVDFNRKWLVLLGMQSWGGAESAASEWIRLIHPDDVSNTIERLNAHLEQRTPAYEAEYRMRGYNGQWKWILARGKVIERDAAGRPLRCVGTFIDVSERKEADLALSRSEQRFRAIFDQTFQFIGLLSREGILLEANRTALDFGGFTREDAVGLPFEDTGWWQISSETRQRLRESIHRAAAGEFVRYEVDIWGAGQAATPIDFSLRPLFNGEGGVDLIIAEGRDISDFRKAQLLLQAEGEKRRLEAVLRSMTIGVVIADPEGNVISMNPAALNLLGIASEQQARRPLRELRAFELRTVGGESVGWSEWPISRALSGETISDVDWQCTRLDTGERRVASFGAAPVRDEAGRLILVVQTMRDVTRQHEVERELRRSKEERDLALQAGQMTFWRWEAHDPDRSLPAAIAGFSGPSNDILDLIHPEEREKVRQYHLDAGCGKVSEVEFRILSSSGDYMWHTSRGRPVVSENGEFLGLTGVTWDITARKTAVAEIERINTSLHQLSGQLLRLQDDERRRLARELHDGPVQTLSGVAMNLSVLARSANLAPFERERRAAEECLAWVKQSSEEMRSLSYLLHSPILDELGLTSALRGWIVGFIERTGLEVDLELEEAGRLGEQRETALFRIAQEALGNAYRHSRSATASVKLHLAANSVVLEVEDKGRGIPQDVLDGRSSSRALGVGIRGMRERAHQLGGELVIESQRGRTLVRVSLPHGMPQ